MTPSCLKNAVSRKIAFFQPPWLYVFGHCDLACCPTEMLRTILELADHPFKRSVAIDDPK